MADVTKNQKFGGRLLFDSSFLSAPFADDDRCPKNCDLLTKAVELVMKNPALAVPFGKIRKLPYNIPNITARKLFKTKDGTNAYGLFSNVLISKLWIHFVKEIIPKAALDMISNFLTGEDITLGWMVSVFQSNQSAFYHREFCDAAATRFRADDNTMIREIDSAKDEDNRKVSQRAGFKDKRIKFLYFMFKWFEPLNMYPRAQFKC
jgi:hypothetical protein